MGKRTGTLPPAAKPWERQPDETEASYRAFSVYRDMVFNGKMRDISKSRTLQEAADIYYTEQHKAAGKPIGNDGLPLNIKATTRKRNIWNWTKQHNWYARVIAFDTHMEELEVKSRIQDVKETKRRQRNYTLQMQKLAVQRLLDLRPDELTPMEAKSFLLDSMREERILLGEPGDIIERKGKIDHTVTATWLSSIPEDDVDLDDTDKD
jgi:hypothetical protein